MLVNIRFQVLFHSPPGVLFTFPSRYFSTIGHQVVFRLGGWSPRLPCGFLVPAGTPDTGLDLAVSSTRLSLALVGLPIPFDYNSIYFTGPYPMRIAAHGLASSAFARRYLQNLV